MNDDDFEYALMLQQKYDQENYELEQTRKKNEKMSIALALKLHNQESVVEFGNTTTAKSLTVNPNPMDSDIKADQFYLKSAVQGFSNKKSYIEFANENESVQYDKASLNINFLTKQYWLELPRRRKELFESASMQKTASLNSYCESMSFISITKSSLIRELTLLASKFDPVEIRYVAAAVKSVNKDESIYFNQLASKVFIYKNNSELRDILLNASNTNSRYYKNERKSSRIHQIPNIIPVLDLHGLFVAEAKQRLIPFFSVCFEKRWRKCALCVGKGKSTTYGYHAKSTLAMVSLTILRKLSSERQFSKRMVLSFNEEKDGLIVIKLNLDCSCFVTT